MAVADEEEAEEAEEDEEDLIVVEHEVETIDLVGADERHHAVSSARSRWRQTCISSFLEFSYSFHRVVPTGTGSCQRFASFT